jgi:predicted ABC-type ATPase
MSDTASKPAPRAIIIAGPNGAGMTTFAREFLPTDGNCPTFINAEPGMSVGIKSTMERTG